MKKITIAVDGYSSCGKSTLAKQLAKTLSYVFVDSGAMYRAITLYFLENNIDIKNTDTINVALKHIDLRFEYVSETGKSDMLLNNRNVEKEIREMKVSSFVSPIAALPAVRTFAVAAQQQMGKQKGIVMDGRDIGTTVFPDAELKIFVTADTDVRVERRWFELHEKGENTSREEVKKNLLERDFIDTTREVSPLKKADDAIVLDNSFLNREEQLAVALEWANERIGNNE